MAQEALLAKKSFLMTKKGKDENLGLKKMKIFLLPRILYIQEVGYKCVAQ